MFSHSLPTLDLLESYVRRWDHNYVRLDGKTVMADRQQQTKDFNTGDSNVFLISTRAGGLGLNLPGANRVVIFDFRWSPMWEEQAVGRAYRIGQKKPVYVYRFIAGGTFEDKIRNQTEFKQQLATRVVDKKDPRRSSSKLSKLLFKPLEEVEKEDVAGFMGKDPLVLDRLLVQTDYVYKIAYTETFIRDEDDELTEEEEKEADRILRESVDARKRAVLGGVSGGQFSSTGVGAAMAGRAVKRLPGGVDFATVAPGEGAFLPDLPAQEVGLPPRKKARLPFAVEEEMGNTSDEGEMDPVEPTVPGVLRPWNGKGREEQQVIPGVGAVAPITVQRPVAKLGTILNAASITTRPPASTAPPLTSRGRAGREKAG